MLNAVLLCVQHDDLAAKTAEAVDKLTDDAAHGKSAPRHAAPLAALRLTHQFSAMFVPRAHACSGTSPAAAAELLYLPADL